MLLKIGDTVKVIAGRDSGETGKVIQIDKDSNKVLVEGVSRVYKHVRKSQRNPQGGRLSKEQFMDASNVMFVCPKTGAPTRLGIQIAEDGTKSRVCKKSGVVVDQIARSK